jgi:hypothetical protein
MVDVPTILLVLQPVMSRVTLGVLQQRGFGVRAVGVFAADVVPLEDVMRECPDGGVLGKASMSGRPLLHLTYLCLHAPLDTQFNQS